MNFYHNQFINKQSQSVVNDFVRFGKETNFSREFYRFVHSDKSTVVENVIFFLVIFKLEVLGIAFVWPAQMVYQKFSATIHEHNSSAQSFILMCVFLNSPFRPM